MSIGERIKITRGALSQEEFAARLNVSKAAIGAYERNISIPGATFIMSIREHFNVSFEWILLGEGIMQTGTLPKPTAPQQQNSSGLQTVATQPSALCTHCAELQNALTEERAGWREVVAENRQLWKEVAELRERTARMENQILDDAKKGRNCPDAPKCAQNAPNAPNASNAPPAHYAPCNGQYNER